MNLFFVLGRFGGHLRRITFSRKLPAENMRNAHTRILQTTMGDDEPEMDESYRGTIGVVVPPRFEMNCVSLCRKSDPLFAVLSTEELEVINSLLGVECGERAGTLNCERIFRFPVFCIHPWIFTQSEAI
jgi:hypothetical protein